jgi:phosphoglycerate dehydrogenase-like enzyme
VGRRGRGRRPRPDRRGVRLTTVLCQLGHRISGQIAEAFPDVDVRAIGTGDSLEDDAEGDVLVTSFWFAEDLPTLVGRGVRWVHNFGTGVDKFPFDLLGPDQVLTCSRGAGAEPISEWVITQMLAFEKKLPASWVTEPPENWNLADLGTLRGRNVGIIGFGGIGQAVARRVLPFGSTVQAYRRRPIPTEMDVEIVDDLLAMAAWADHLVITAPATPETHHLVGPDVLDVLGPGAHIVNIARGELIDQDALLTALDDGRVALASLDTVTPEPLPDGHWMYGHPQVHLSAHISWSSPERHDRILGVFLEELARWEAGEPLECVVDVAAGY